MTQDNIKKLILIISLVLLVTSTQAQDYDKSVSILYCAAGYYNQVGVSFVKMNGNKGIYTDLKYAQSTGVYQQKYKHITGHVGFVYDWHSLIDPYIAIGIYQENITWFDEEFNKQVLSSFNIATGFLISSKNKRIGWQQGFELDLGELDRVGVNVVFGLIVNF